MTAVRPFVIIAILSLGVTPVQAQFETNESKAQRLLNRNHRGVLNVIQLGAIYVSTDMKLFQGETFQRPAPGQFCYRCTLHLAKSTWRHGHLNTRFLFRSGWPTVCAR